MKRIIMLSVALTLAAGTASADYVLVKINMNQLSFSIPGQPSGGPGTGKGPPMPPPFDPKKPPPPPPTPPEDPNPKWITAYVEMLNRAQKATVNHPWYMIFPYDHHWGRKNLMVMSPMFPMYGDYIPHESFIREFGTKFSSEKSEKVKTVQEFLNLARWTLSRGRVKEFHEVMQEAEKIDPKNVNVKQCLRVRNYLQKPFKDDPAQLDLRKDLSDKGYKSYTSKEGHYRIYAHPAEHDRRTEAAIQRRLALMEDTLDTFYSWFALREEPELLKRPLKLPRYRLNAVVTATPEEFQSKYLAWGQPPIVGDGFTPRRANVIVMTAKSRLDDPRYLEYESLLQATIDKANQKLKDLKVNVTVTREELLNGNLSNPAKNPLAVKVAMVNVGVAQGAVLLAKTLESEAERQTVTHHAIRQLLTASEMFPRHVQVPEWVIEGLAGFFETPRGAVYPTIGSTSWTHLISFKYLDKTGRLEVPQKVTAGDVLKNVVTDAYFTDAGQLTKEGQNPKAARDAWELARCSSWAIVYYLSEKKKLHYLFNYGDELDKLPRDLDLNDAVLQAVFAKAFNMSDARNARQLDETKLKNEAGRWLEMIRAANMDGANRDILKIQANYEQKRASQDNGKTNQGKLGGT